MIGIRRSRTIFAVLGFLASGPKTGYDIRSAISRSTSFFWNESFGQIYPILTKLTALGWAELIPARQPGRRGRQSYAITPAGSSALREWLKSPAQSEIVRNEMLLKLFFSKYSCLQDAKKQIVEAARRSERRVSVLEAVQTKISAADSKIYEKLAIGYGFAIEKAIIEWSKEALTTLECEESNLETSTAPRSMSRM